jgi:glucose-6-phosphate 1-dehydrogenase
VVIAQGARVKVPGEPMVGANVELIAREDTQRDMLPYERLLGDALRGDSSLFTRDDCVEAAWAIVDPVLNDKRKVESYARGSWGPESSDKLIAKDGGWRNPEASAT